MKTILKQYTTVQYYLTEPRLDVGEADDFGFHFPFTAVARLLAFTLMAMHSSQRSQAWQNEAARSRYTCGTRILKMFYTTRLPKSDVPLHCLLSTNLRDTS